MADNAPDWATPAPSAPDWAKDAPKPSDSAKDDRNQFISAVTDIPHEIYGAGKEALSTIGETLNPFSAERQARLDRIAKAPSFASGIGETISQIPDVGRGVMAIPSLAAAPITGAARSLIGHPYSAITGMPYEGDGEFTAKKAVDTAMMGVMPSRGGLSTLRGPTPVPLSPTGGPLGVTLSEGQKTGELPLIRREQAALRGQSGADAGEIAQAFRDQQSAQVAAAKGDVAKSLDPFGQQVAEGPQEAGAIVSDAIKTAAAQRKAGVRQAYEAAQALPGEIHAGAFEGIAQKIKGDLSLGDNPVIVDDKTTPHASNALQDIEKTIDRLRIQNRADPFGQPNPENITGVNLKGVDQVRKRLSTFRNDAWKSGNNADGRAASAIVDAFDNHVDQAIKGGLFKGDPRAVNAWWDARAAHSDYRKTFAKGSNDPIGRVVERILGKGNNPAAIPNDVADFIYGSSGVNPGTREVAVANRVRTILGEQSPEWSAVKQGLFSRLVEPGAGVTDWGSGRVSQNLNKFLNNSGKELAGAVFSPSERALIQQYADLHRSLEVPPTGANWSGSAGGVAPMLKRISTGIAGIIGAVIGHTVAPGAYGMGELIGATATGKGAAKLQDVMQARQIAKQMPLAANAIKQWQKAVARANLANSPQSQAALGFAAANMSRTLASLGVKLPEFAQGPGTAYGDTNQQNIPRPEGQHKDGGRVQEKRNHPKATKARLAPDGHYYLSDPRRPGKYLRVMSHG